MSGRPSDPLKRLSALEPLVTERLEQELNAPWVGALKESIPQASRQVAVRRSRRRRRMPAVVLIAGAALFAGGAATGVLVYQPGPVAPATPAGKAYVESFLEGVRVRSLQQKLGPAFVPVPSSAQVVLRELTPAGEYTIWTARAEGRGGLAVVFSSPRTGFAAVSGPMRPLDPPFVDVLGSVSRSGPLAAREFYGRVSADIRSVDVVLADGTRRRVAPRSGWFYFSARSPVEIVGLNDEGQEVARFGRPL